MTTGRHGYPTRIACRFAAKNGEVVLDQLRTVDQARLIKHLGNLDPAKGRQVLARLQEMFS